MGARAGARAAGRTGGDRAKRPQKNRGPPLVPALVPVAQIPSPERLY